MMKSSMCQSAVVMSVEKEPPLANEICSFVSVLRLLISYSVMLVSNYVTSP